MEYFNGTSQRHRQYNWMGIVISLGIHAAVLALVLTAPFYTHKTVIPQDVMDVALFDFPGTGESFDFDIVAGGIGGGDGSGYGSGYGSGEYSGEGTIGGSDIIIPDGEYQPMGSGELVDPSDAELSRMKKRDDNRKLPPRRPSSGSGPPGFGIPGHGSFGMKTGFMPGGSGKATGSLRLDSGNFQFIYYLAMLKGRISENWIPPFGSVKSDESKRVLVHFRIDRQGRVISPEIEESSGDNLLDQSALRAVIVSGPFPALPAGYPDATLGVHFGFSCQL